MAGWPCYVKISHPWTLDTCVRSNVWLQEPSPRSKSLIPSKSQEANPLVLWGTNQSKQGQSQKGLSQGRNLAENSPKLCSVLGKQQRSGAGGKEEAQSRRGPVPEKQEHCPGTCSALSDEQVNEDKQNQGRLPKTSLTMSTSLQSHPSQFQQLFNMLWNLSNFF